MNTLVTLDINNITCENVKKNHSLLARKWNCDYITIKENFYENCYPSWNKFYILENLNYDRVLFLDSDTIINPECPDPFVYKDDFIAVKDMHDICLNDPILLSKTIADYITPHFDYLKSVDKSLNNSYIEKFFNTGVMLFTPKIISPLIKKYKNLINTNKLNGTSHREQTLINYIIQKEIDVFYLERKWNVIDPDITKPMDGNIYHFTGPRNKELKKEIFNYKWQ